MPPTPPRELPPLVLENLQTIYRTNFEGRIEGFNKDGTREFNALVPPPLAEALERDGWNIKWSKPGKNHPNPEEFVSQPYVPVKVGYEMNPPTVVLIREGKPQFLTEKNVSLVDSVEFSNVDVVIRAVYWKNDSGEGYKAYLKSLYGTVVVDDLDSKYAYLYENMGGGSGSDDED